MKYYRNNYVIKGTVPAQEPSLLFISYPNRNSVYYTESQQYELLASVSDPDLNIPLL